MTPFQHHSAELKAERVLEPNRPVLNVAESLYRETEMVGLGVGAAIADTVNHPLAKLPELGISALTGAALGAIGRLGAPGRIVASGIAAAMLLKLGYDEYRGRRWTKFAEAADDAWRSGVHMGSDITATRDSLGSFIVDTGIGCIGMRAGSLAAASLAPPARLVDSALSCADSDGGIAIRRLQDRFENAAGFQRHVPSELDLVVHSQPAVTGEPRGDLVRVATTNDGKMLLAAMDVEGHGVGAAKKAVMAHAAIDQILPETGNKSASDILALIDRKLDPKDERAITAALMTYDPLTHSLDTATASSELAFMVRADGSVRQLDSEGGLGLGTDMYGSFPRGHEVTNLDPGDSVIMASDGVFDRFGYGSANAFRSFLEKTGADPAALRDGILATPPPEAGVDDTSFLILHRH